MYCELLSDLLRELHQTAVAGIDYPGVLPSRVTLTSSSEGWISAGQTEHSLLRSTDPQCCVE